MPAVGQKAGDQTNKLLFLQMSGTWSKLAERELTSAKQTQAEDLRAWWLRAYVR
jgi:hypothetical protein